MHVLYTQQQARQIRLYIYQRHFLGIFHTKKGYKYYDHVNHKFYISRDVTFQENKPYFKKLEKENNAQDPSNIFIFPSIEYLVSL
jgi:hypothetical protein